MAAMLTVPTVRATAAPKVAVRRTSVRAAASGLRTQFGSSTKAFAPLGYVTGAPSSKIVTASASVILAFLARPAGPGVPLTHRYDRSARATYMSEVMVLPSREWRGSRADARVDRRLRCRFRQDATAILA